VSLDYLRDRPKDSALVRERRQTARAIVDELKARGATEEWIDTASLDPASLDPASLDTMSIDPGEHKAAVAIYRKPAFNRRGLSADIATLARLRHELERQGRIGRKGGKKSSGKRRKKNVPRNADILEDVERMLADPKVEQRTIAGKLAIKNKLTPNQIRNIAPILKKKAKTKPA
jgi:hypothetical protein